MGSTKKIDFSKIQEEIDYIGSDPVDISKLKEVVEANIRDICECYIWEFSNESTQEKLKLHIENFLNKITSEQKTNFSVKFSDEKPLDWIEEIFGRRPQKEFNFDIIIYPRESTDTCTLNFYFKE